MKRCQNKKITLKIKHCLYIQVHVGILIWTFLREIACKCDFFFFLRLFLACILYFEMVNCAKESEKTLQKMNLRYKKFRFLKNFLDNFAVK